MVFLLVRANFLLAVYTFLLSVQGCFETPLQRKPQ